MMVHIALLVVTLSTLSGLLFGLFISAWKQSVAGNSVETFLTTWETNRSTALVFSFLGFVIGVFFSL